MPPEIQFQFTPTPVDYRRAAFFFYTRQKLFWIVVVISVLLFIITLVSLFGGQTPFSDISYLLIFSLVCFGFVVVSLVLTPYRLSRQAAQNENLVSEMKWTVGDEHIQVMSKAQQSHLDWTIFGGYAEGEDYILLLSAKNKNSFQIIPKRAFASADELNEFREMLKRHLKPK